MHNHRLKVLVAFVLTLALIVGLYVPNSAVRLGPQPAEAGAVIVPIIAAIISGLIVAGVKAYASCYLTDCYSYRYVGGYSTADWRCTFWYGKSGASVERYDGRVTTNGYTKSVFSVYITRCLASGLKVPTYVSFQVR